MNAKSVLIASVAAALLLSGSVIARADEASGKNDVRCAGVNSCKGHGSCKSAQNDCKGQNACKGQGVVLMSSAESCTGKGGTVAPAPEKKD